MTSKLKNVVLVLLAAATLYGGLTNPPAPPEAYIVPIDNSLQANETAPSTERQNPLMDEPA